jgi:hypothetical protein
MNQIFKRYEFKYPIPTYFVPSIQALLLRHGMHADPSAALKPNSTYIVTSLYFDSPTLSDYHDKAGGFLSRKKIRVRIYDTILTKHTKEIWLEKKAKHDMLVAKKRIPLPITVYQELLTGSRTRLLHQYSENPYMTEILSHIIREQMQPRLITRYRRTPLLMPGPADFRITFDSHIETCFSRDLCYASPMKLVSPGITVMEVKFATILPAWFKEVIQRYDLSRSSFSKYANALEALRVHNPVPR